MRSTLTCPSAKTCLSASRRWERREKIRKRVKEAAEILQITELLDRRPGQLSGGQRQRVAIGRAIVREPGIFLFDEPLSNLDAELRMQMRVEINKLHRRLGATMIFVTHDQVEAMTLADRIVVLRSGVVEQVGTPLELYNRPSNLFVAGFIGSPRMNLIPAKFSAADGGGLEVAAASGMRLAAFGDSVAEPGDAATIGIRPEALVVVPKDEAIMVGEVQIAEQLGGETFVYVSLPSGETLTIEIKGQADIRPKERVGIGFDPEAAHVFGPDGKAIPRRAASVPKNG